MSSRQITSDSLMILVFPPGCGGNHLSNLLSLSNIFQKHFVSDDYPKDLYEKYKFGKIKGNHHFGPLENLHINDWAEVYNNFTKKGGVPIICCHAVEYYNFLNTHIKIKTFDCYSKKNIILFSFPNEDSSVYNRFYSLRKGEGIDLDNIKLKFTIDTYKKLYIPEVFDSGLVLNFPMLCRNGYKSQLNNIIEFDTNLFVEENGFDYVEFFFKINYNIELPKFGREIHKLWYKNII